MATDYLGDACARTAFGGHPERRKRGDAGRGVDRGSKAEPELGGPAGTDRSVVPKGGVAGSILHSPVENMDSFSFRKGIRLSQA